MISGNGITLDMAYTLCLCGVTDMTPSSHNPLVGGSSPPGPTIFIKGLERKYGYKGISNILM